MNDKAFYTKKRFKFLLLICILLIIWLIGKHLKIDIDYYQTFLSQYPVGISGLIYVLLYTGITFFVWFGTKDIFRITGAVLFGPFVSTVLVWCAEMLNATVLFHLSRKLGRDYVEQRFHLKSKDVDKVQQDSSFLGVFTLRINPLVPFRLMDLGYGLTQISFKKYITAIMVASPMRILWLQFILAGVGASVFQNLSKVMDYLIKHPFIISYSGVYFLIVIVLSLITVIAKIIKTKRIKRLHVQRNI